MKLLRNLGLSALALIGLSATAQAQFVDVDSDISADTTWTNDNVYTLTRVIIVNDGATLTIEPGTIIRGLPSPDNSSITSTVYGQVEGSGIDPEPGSLLVARGAQLIANGTPEQPIIFTSIDDPNVPGGASTIPPTVVNSQGTTLTRDGDTDGIPGPDYGSGFGGTVISGLETRDYAPDSTDTLDQAPSVGNNGFSHAALWGGLQICGKAFLGDGSASAPGFADTNTDGIPDADVTQSGWGGVQQPAPDVNAASKTNLELFTKSGVAVARPTVAGGGYIPQLGTAVGNGAGTEYIEGIDVANLGSRGFQANYGGVDDEDCSGCIRWVQIRYGGFPLGGVAAANEINSYTTGANGSETVAQFIENTFNQDDGTEPFGGANDTSFIFSHYIMDDSFDGDEGVRGLYQFEHALQGSFTEDRNGWGNPADGTPILQAFGPSSPAAGNSYDMIMEIDDAEGAGGSLPETALDRFNGTFVTEGGDQCLDLDSLVVYGIRSQIYELAALSSSTDFAGNLLADSKNSSAPVADQNYDNVHYFDKDGTADGTEMAELTSIGVGATEATAGILRSTSRYTKDGYDPRPKSVALGDPADDAALAFDGPVQPAGYCLQTFAGFQRYNTFLKGWSHLDALDVVTETLNPDRVVPAGPAERAGQANTILTWSVPGDHPSDTIYWVLTSDDQCNWTPVATVRDNDGVVVNETDTADDDGTTGVVEVDLGAAPSAGDVAYYIVIAN